MRVEETITYVINFEVKHLSIQNVIQLYGDVLKFQDAWPSASLDMDTDLGEVRISYKNFTNLQNVAYDAANAFLNNVRRYTWWEENNGREFFTVRGR